jgi:hypothetical protein
MKNAAFLKTRLEFVEKEIKRISDVIEFDDEVENSLFMFSDGTPHPGTWTFHDAHIAYISQRSLLRELLNN